MANKDMGNLVTNTNTLRFNVETITYFESIDVMINGIYSLFFFFVQTFLWGV